MEPRLLVRSVQATRERQNGTNVLTIRLRYDLVDRQVPGNDVLLAGIEQTITV